MIVTQFNVLNDGFQIVFNNGVNISSPDMSNINLNYNEYSNQLVISYYGCLFPLKNKINDPVIGQLVKTDSGLNVAISIKEHYGVSIF